MTTAHGTITDRRLAVVTLESDGFAGQGEASSLAGFGLETQAEAEAVLDAWVESGTPPASPAARAAVANAEANLAASRSGITLASHLRGSDADRTVATQAVIGDDDVESTVTTGMNAVAAGHNTLKVKVAARAANDDFDRISALRSAVGHSVRLRLDANCGWDLDTAIDCLRHLQSLDIDFIEEPTPDPLTFTEIQATTGVGVALDEHAGDAELVMTLTLAGIAGVIVKPAIVGGVVAAHDLALGVLERGSRAIVSSFMDGWVGLDSAVQVACALPSTETHGLGTASMFVEEFPNHLTAQQGRVGFGRLNPPQFSSRRR